ncbi:FtsK/SpoIIIE domain-containing protein [Rhizomonospora bruguierae]|uniref:FtsK/SpoIIIE domain-containing protein n=1 Tax=Rhizomonospora bruguierae TaxID=1581705 RepID=UPI001BCC9965
MFAPFAPLADAGVLPPPATDRAGLRAVLAEAEQWVQPARQPSASRGSTPAQPPTEQWVQPARQPSTSRGSTPVQPSPGGQASGAEHHGAAGAPPLTGQAYQLAPAGHLNPPPAGQGQAGPYRQATVPVQQARVAAATTEQVTPANDATPRPVRRNRTMLLVIASFPELTEGSDLARIAALAQYGPAAGLHLIVAGWPPPPLTAETTQPPLQLTTAIAVRNPYALVGNPPVGSFSAPPAQHVPGTGLNAPVYLDDDPPAHLFERVCRELAARSQDQARLRLTDLLPEATQGLWAEDAKDGLATVVGRDGDRPLILRFDDLTPHWMVGGRSGAGKTAFLINVLYGLCTRHGPDELLVYLLDFKEGVSFTEFTPTPRDASWLPHARAVGVESDREYGLAVLRHLDGEMTRRSVAYKQAGVTRFADLREHQPLPRIVCVIDEFQVLLAGTDRLATEAVALLESLARKGRSYGIHLVLASQTVRGVESLYAKRDSIFGQFPVRVALPGGGDVLDPTNDAAAGLPLGTAVVNTAGGFGGPRGATRGHERTVRFPDPHADRPALDRLRHRLWEARPAGSPPPRVFQGYADQHLADDVLYRAAVEGRRGRHTVLLGRLIDVDLNTAAFPLDTSPGRHLAILGPSPLGADLLDAAARGLAAQHDPGTTRFVIASLVDAGDTVAARLAEDVGREHETRLVDAAGMVEALAADHPGYLIVFGMDAGGRLPGERLRALLREGPSRGVHLLAWWRGPRRFTEEVGGSAREDVAGLVLLNVPATDAALLLGAPVDWRPRPNRALLHDRHADRTAVFVPFVRPEAER